MAVEPKTPKSGGSKLLRSEVTTVRLDPKLRYLAELAARKQRRTLSSYIEWAVQHSLSAVQLHTGTGYNGDESVTVEEVANTLWDVDESERFIRLAIAWPDLLTHEEQEWWKMLSDSGLLSPARLRDRNGEVQWDRAMLDDKVFREVRGVWDDLKHAHGIGPAARAAWATSIRQKIAEGKIYPPRVAYAPAPAPRHRVPPQEPAADDDIPF